MKAAVLLVVSTCLTSEVLAQCLTGGTLHFRTYLPPGVNGQLTFSDGSPVLGPRVAGGPGWYAELLYAPTATESLRPLTGSFDGGWADAVREPFRAATGYVLGHVWALDGVPQNGTEVSFAVVGYYAPTGSEHFTDVLAAHPNGDGWFAVSDRAWARPGSDNCISGGMPPGAFYALQSWVVPVPEPSILALARCGLLVLAVTKRRGLGGR